MSVCPGYVVCPHWYGNIYGIHNLMLLREPGLTNKLMREDAPLGERYTKYHTTVYWSGSRYSVQQYTHQSLKNYSELCVAFLQTPPSRQVAPLSSLFLLGSLSLPRSCRGLLACCPLPLYLPPPQYVCKTMRRNNQFDHGANALAAVRRRRPTLLTVTHNLRTTDREHATAVVRESERAR